jgi:hypothetical protein
MNKWEKALAYKRKRPFDHLEVCREQGEQREKNTPERRKSSAEKRKSL